MKKSNNRHGGRKNSPNLPIMFDMGAAPIIEMLGNRRITIEGSTGILLYKSENIKVNTCGAVISLEGRGLTLKCISCSCVEIEGFVTNISFAL